MRDFFLGGRGGEEEVKERRREAETDVLEEVVGASGARDFERVAAGAEYERGRRYPRLRVVGFVDFEDVVVVVVVVGGVGLMAGAGVASPITALNKSKLPLLLLPLLTLLPSLRASPGASLPKTND